MLILSDNVGFPPTMKRPFATVFNGNVSSSFPTHIDREREDVVGAFGEQLLQSRLPHIHGRHLEALVLQDDQRKAETWVTPTHRRSRMSPAWPWNTYTHYLQK
jgi:hypothetical protein